MKTSPKQSNLVTDLFNPARGQLQSIRECLEQLRETLPANKDEYINADRMTRALVKNCFLMVVQRAIDTNSVVIEAVGKRPPYRKNQTFLAVWDTGAINNQTLEFFTEAVDIYQKMVKDEDLPSAKIYNVTQGLLKHGEGYINQVEKFFSKSNEPSNALSEELGRREDKIEAKDSTAGQSPSQQAKFAPLERIKLDSESPPETRKVEAAANYKGELQTLCMRQGVGAPIYHSEQSGTPHEPIWMVAVQYGDETYTTPSPIHGSKKHAEHMAAKQVIEHLRSQTAPPNSNLQSERVKTCEGKNQTERKIDRTAPSQHESLDIQQEIKRLSREINAETLQVSSELVGHLASLANNWLSRSDRGKRYLRMMDNPNMPDLIGLDLADLTFRLTRAFLKSADRHQIEIVDSSPNESQPKLSSRNED